MFRRAAVAVCMCVVAACATSSGESPCSAGQERACDCPDATVGVQACIGDGPGWGECECTPTPSACLRGATRECACPDVGADLHGRDCLG